MENSLPRVEQPRDQWHHVTKYVRDLDIFEAPDRRMVTMDHL